MLFQIQVCHRISLWHSTSTFSSPYKVCIRFVLITLSMYVLLFSNTFALENSKTSAVTAMEPNLRLLRVKSQTPNAEKDIETTQQDLYTCPQCVVGVSKESKIQCYAKNAKTFTNLARSQWHMNCLCQKLCKWKETGYL